MLVPDQSRTNRDQVPDQSHINRVRDALWQRFGGGASVMVGSGFSKHALKTRPDAEDPPLWRDVIEGMSCKLYPKGTNGIPATDGHLRIAQEYETAFGRSDLHHFIRQTVRDDDFNPGDVHARLLRLPWRDVFTTNWDTLLERVRTSVPERAYSVLRTMDEIPLASRPRIIKLHGSLPAQFPLICTEEDYRTYPTKFAPFINTVQQAMMETVFCLIGFSGDDPNFLQWSGWVRDNLGGAAPKIYLAGWLDLSPHRRRMLEGRNVVPVDLAHHPKAGTWPEHLRHDYATEWILHTLELGCPYDVTNWPLPNVQAPLKLPTHLEPVEVVTFDTPQEESWPVSSSNEPENNEKSVRKVLEVWTHNRKVYPGWLAVPANSRFSININRNTEKWEKKILNVLPEFSPVDRLNAIHELVWRREIMLKPILSHKGSETTLLEKSADEVLTEIDCENRKINGDAVEPNDWGVIREAWRSVQLALVTTARFRFEQEIFDKRIKALKPFRQDHPDVDQRIHHERCLWAAYSLDFQNLESLLETWRTEGCDPVWMLRKAALLVEVNRAEDAKKLLDCTLSTIRKNPGDGRSVAGPSREGWALCLVAAFERWRPGQDPVEMRQSFIERDERLVELATLKCDPFAELKRYEEDIVGETEKVKKLPFDLGVSQSNGFTYSNAEDNQGLLAAYRAVRLYEVAGLTAAGSRILKLAAEKLSASNLELAARLILRISNYDEDAALTHMFSRTRVATMSTGLAKRLAQDCSNTVEHALPHITSKLGVALEVLSRLVLRLEPDTVQDVFNRALTHYQTETIARHSWLADPVRNLLKRSWEALPEAQRTARVVDLLGAPIVGLDLHVNPNTELRYPDPGELLQNKLPVFTRARDDEGRWQEIVSLLVRGLRAGGEARKRAACRIASIALSKQKPLTEAEQSRVAEALWRSDTDAVKGLPNQTTLYDWVFLLMPQPRPGIAEQCFRTKWLVPNRMPQEDAPSPHDILWQVGRAITGLKIHQQPLVLSEDEQSYLIEAIEQWLNTPIPDHVDPFFHGDPLLDAQLHEPTLHAIDGLRSILTEVQIPEAIGEKLHTRIQALNESNIPGFVLIAGLVAGLVKALPDRLAELALSMRMKLASENEDIARGAVTGLHHWLMISAENTPQIHPPPDDLIREIGVIIANRRKASLASSLQAAKWVFDEGNDEQKKTIHNLVLQGLGYLVEELRYDRDHDLNDDVPLLRWCSVQLALSMAEHGSKDAPAVSRWLEIAENDPLPEVRYAKHSAITRES